MSIFPLPVFEADGDPRHRSALSDAEIYARLEPPKTIVVRFGCMKLIGEYAYDGDAKPGCGTKLVARTHRGTEVVEMLTTTCENAGCSKSVTRQEMLEFIENSGGQDYPFHDKGRVLRVATIDDLNQQSALNEGKKDIIRACRLHIAELGLAMKLVEVEPILGQELLTFYFTAEDRVDFRELVRRLAAEFKTRIEMRQVGARDEARLVADYERCGQYCCCKNFLKVLKPISMKSAKLQKATLDPLKISGRCGRLMCCLRYEDQTYKELKRNLPPRNSRVGTSEGPGIVVDGKILVQLVLVRLDDGREVAVPVEELMDPETCPRPPPGGRLAHAADEGDPLRGLSVEEVQDRARADRGRRDRGRRRGRGGDREASQSARQEAFRRRSESEERSGESPSGPAAPAGTPGAPPRDEASGPVPEAPSGGGPGVAGSGPPAKRRKRRRRRKGPPPPAGGTERPPEEPGPPLPPDSR